MAVTQLWEISEKDGFDWLVKHYGHETTFYYHGKSNSNNSYYAMITSSNKSINIGAKCEISQIAQFTVIDTGSEFQLSPNAKTKFSPAMKPFFDELNKNYNEYRNCGTAGKTINVKNSDSVTYIQHFLGTCKNEPIQLLLRTDSNHIIYDSEHPERVFEIVAKIRKKRSGSQKPPFKDEQNIIVELINLGCFDTPFRDSDNHLLVTTLLDLNNRHFSIAQYTYEIKEENGYVNTYRISRLSNTCNPTVIFSLKAKKDLVQNQKDLDLFNSIRFS